MLAFHRRAVPCTPALALRRRAVPCTVAFRRRAVPCALALALAAAPLGAQAAPSGTEQRTAAQTLYDKAVAAMDRSDYATACPALEEVVRLAPEGLGAKLTLARCYERTGRLASAWATYAATEEAGVREKRSDRWKPARERRQALEPQLARVTVVVPPEVGALPGLSVTRDGVPVGPAQWQVAVPVDRGKHVIVATATGKQRWEKAIEIAADGERAEVVVEALRDEPRRLDAPPKKSDGAQASSSWSALKIAGLAVGGVGVVGLGVGAAFGIQAISKQSDSNDGHCSDTRCDPEGRQLREDGLAAGNVSTVFFIAGGALLAGGIVLFAVAPSPRKTEVSVGLGGLTVRGTF